jgi:hypothetical protein
MFSSLVSSTNFANRYACEYVNISLEDAAQMATAAVMKAEMKRGLDRRLAALRILE